VRPVDNIIKWLELYSINTGSNIFSIPLQLIVTKTKNINQKTIPLEKQRFEKEVEGIVVPAQITYCCIDES